MLTQYLNHFKHLRDSKQLNRLGIEIAVILVVKVFLLYLLWALCFSNPIAKETRQLAVTRILLHSSN
jgi:hypothetical protein